MKQRSSPSHNKKTDICTGCAMLENTMCETEGPNRVDLLIVGGFPMPRDITAGAFRASGSGTVRQMVQNYLKTLPIDKKPNVAYTYAVKCCPQEQDFKVTVDQVNQCSKHLHMYLDRVQPKVILALGVDAARAIGIKGKISDLRGVIQDNKVVTYQPGQLKKQPGLVPVVKKDVHKAINLTIDAITDWDLNIVTEKDPDKIVAHLEDMQDQARRRYQETGKPLAISVDTETTSLTPYHKEDRIIAISLSVKMYEGFAFPFEHRECPYSEKVRDKLIEVLNSEFFIVMHNAKFDYQWMGLRYGMDIPYAGFDTMLVEHKLEEDKKGEYSLKDLAKDYFPSLANYESELKEELDRINKEREAAYKELVKEYKLKTDEAFIDYWLELDDNQRLSKLTEWVGAGYISGNSTSELYKVKRRKYKGELQVPKKYKNAVSKMLKSVPLEKTDVVLPDGFPEEPVPATFEDVDIDTMLKYAGMDAAITKMAAGEQLKLMQEDSQLIANTEKSLQNTLKTKPLMWALNNIDMPLNKCIAKMEYAGVRIDRDKTRHYIETLENTLEEIEDGIFTEVGEKFSLSSSAPDLKRILFEDKQYPPIKYSDSTGEPSTDAETIKELSDRYDDPLLDKLLKQRKISKCINTYLKNWLDMSAYDGRLHCKFNQTTTATHRLSSSGPNL